MLRRYLVEEGFKVSDAADGAGMRTVLTRKAIDLVLLDLMMPGEDGLSLARGGRGGFGPAFITALTADAKSSSKDYTKILAFLPTNRSSRTSRIVRRIAAGDTGFGSEAYGRAKAGTTSSSAFVVRTMIGR
jgi:CheY-like chemotaxis protein